MMEDQDIRWKQRFMNFEKVLNQLTKFIEHGKLNEFEEQGLIQCFEYNYELAWNVMKDYFEYQGEEAINGSRDAIRLAFRRNLIQEGELWMDMIKSRIMSSHTYNEATSDEIVKKITENYYKLFLDFQTKMKTIS